MLSGPQFLAGTESCFGCTVGCKRICKITEGPFAGWTGPGPEYEGVVALGTYVDVGNPQFVVVLDDLDALEAPGLMQRARALRWANAASPRRSMITWRIAARRPTTSPRHACANRAPATPARRPSAAWRRHRNQNSCTATS